MNLSMHTDFGCRTLIYLSLLPQGVRVSIDDIASAFGISANHLMKVVHRLGVLGYVETVRGRGGGLSLARQGAEISIGAVVRAMEPSLTIVECFDPATNTCPIAGVCGLQTVLSRASAAFFEVLDNVTIADIARDKGGLQAMLGLSTLDR